MAMSRSGMTGPERYGTRKLEPDGCASCGDTAVPTRVLKRHGGIALVEDRLGRRAEVALDFVPETTPGDMLLVRAGVALARMKGVA